MEAALQVRGTSIYVRRAITALALGGSEGVGQLALGWKVLPLGLCAALLAFLGNSTHARHSTPAHQRFTLPPYQLLKRF